jgi:ArsR family transcriptional regulator, arsenate/arsenite/antimonite-responsive transcriptional repressor
METIDVVGALAALAHTSRLAVFRLLVCRGPEGHTPGELAEKLGIPAPTLSFHLKTLQQAGLVAADRDGRFLHYRPEIGAVNALVSFLTENCCSEGSVGCTVRKPAKTLRKRA